MLQIFIEINIKVFLVLFLYGFLMGKIRQLVVGRMMTRSSRGILVNLLNLVGTPVHEIGHLLFGLLFGYRITEVCFYKTIRQAARTDRTLGYVKMTHRKGGFFRELWMDIGGFFVGIGPLLSGPAVIFMLYQILPETMQTVIQNVFKGQGWQNLQHSLTALQGFELFGMFLYLFVVLGIVLNMELSAADLKMAGKGFLVLEGITLIVSMGMAFYL